MDGLARARAGEGGILQSAEAYARGNAGAARKGARRSDDALNDQTDEAELAQIMITAICSKCGAAKNGAFEACGGCGRQPEAPGDFALSLVLTNRFCDPTTLEELSQRIADGLSRFDLIYALPPRLTKIVLYSWHHTDGEHQDGGSEAEMAAAAEERFVQVEKNAESLQGRIPFWCDSPHLVRSVESFDRAPRSTREEMLAQDERTHGERQKPSVPR